MELTTRRLIARSFTTLLCAGALIAAPAVAQDARRAMTIVVPYPAGGGNDLFARLIASKMQVGKPIVIDNRTGASGSIGTAAVTRSAPDGNTLLYAAATIAINGWLYKDLGFDVARDLRAVTITLSSPLVLVVHPSLPVSDAKALIALAKRHPGEITFSSGGVGSATQFAMEAFKVSAKVDLHHIPYRGAAPALTAVVSGEVQSAFLVPSIVQPYLQNGKLKALGISSSTRSKALPDLPPLHELGAPGFQSQQWHAVFVPSATPDSTIANLYRGISAALNTPDVSKRIEAAGASKLDYEPAKAHAFVLDEIRYWGEVAKRANLAAGSAPSQAQRPAGRKRP